MTGPRVVPPRPCVNGRHDGHKARQGAACDRRLPRAPVVHRAAGAVAVAALVTFGVAFTVGWKAGEWIATEGRVRAELARARWETRR